MRKSKTIIGVCASLLLVWSGAALANHHIERGPTVR